MNISVFQNTNAAQKQNKRKKKSEAVCSQVAAFKGQQGEML